MAVTGAHVGIEPITDANGRKHVVRKLTFDSSYPTGGESLTAAMFGLTTLDQVICHGVALKSDVSAGVPVGYDYANSKLVAFFQKDPADAGGANIALPEVGNTISLASYSVYCTGIGR